MLLFQSYESLNKPDIPPTASNPSPDGVEIMENSMSSQGNEGPVIHSLSLLGFVRSSSSADA